MKNKVLISMGIGIAAALVPAAGAQAAGVDTSPSNLNNLEDIDESQDNVDFNQDGDADDKLDVNVDKQAMGDVDQSSIQEGSSGLNDPVKVGEVTIIDRDETNEKYEDGNHYDSATGSNSYDDAQEAQNAAQNAKDNNYNIVKDADGNEISTSQEEYKDPTHYDDKEKANIYDTEGETDAAKADAESQKFTTSVVAISSNLSEDSSWTPTNNVSVDDIKNDPQTYHLLAGTTDTYYSEDKYGAKTYYKIEVTPVDPINANYSDDNSVSANDLKDTSKYTPVSGVDHVYYTEDADGAKTYYKVVPVAISDFTTGWTSTSKSYDEIRALATDPVSGYKYEIGADGQKIYYKVDVTEITDFDNAGFVDDENVSVETAKTYTQVTGQDHIYYTEDADGAKTYYKVVPVAISDFATGWTSTSKSYDEIRALATDPVSGYKYEIGADGQKIYYKVDVTEITDFDNAGFVDDENVSVETAKTYTQVTGQDHIYYTEDADGAKTYYKVVPVAISDFTTGWTSTSKSYDEIRALATDPVSGYKYEIGADGQKIYYKVDVTEITDFDNAGFVDDENVSVETAKTYTQVTGQDHIYYTEDADGAKTYYKVVPVAISDFTTGWTSTSKSYDEIRALATDPVSGYKYEIGADGQKIYYKVDVTEITDFDNAGFVDDENVSVETAKTYTQVTGQDHIYYTEDADGAKTYYKVVPVAISDFATGWTSTSKSYDEIRALATDPVSGYKYEIGADGQKIYYKVDVTEITDFDNAGFVDDENVSVETAKTYTQVTGQDHIYYTEDADGAKTYYKVVPVAISDFATGWTSTSKSYDEIRALATDPVSGYKYEIGADGQKIYYKVDVTEITDFDNAGFVDDENVSVETAKTYTQVTGQDHIYYTEDADGAKTYYKVVPVAISDFATGWTSTSKSYDEIRALATDPVSGYKYEIGADGQKIYYKVDVTEITDFDNAGFVDDENVSVETAKTYTQVTGQDHIYYTEDADGAKTYYKVVPVAISDFTTGWTSTSKSYDEIRALATDPVSGYKYEIGADGQKIYYKVDVTEITDFDNAGFVDDENVSVETAKTYTQVTGQDHIYYTEDADGAKTYYKVVPVAISDFATGWTSTSKSYDEIRALATDPVSGYKYEIGADGQKIYYKVDVTEITDFDNAGFVDDENVSVETAKTYTQVTGQDHIYYTEDADGAKTYYKVVPVAISDFATGWTSTSKSYDEIRALATDPVSGYKYEIGADGQKIYYKVDVTEITDFDNAGFVDDENVSVETAKTYTQVTGQDHIYYTEDADGAKTYYKVVPVAISDFATGWTSTSKSYDEIRALATDPVSGYKYEIGADGQKIYYKVDVTEITDFDNAGFVDDENVSVETAKTYTQVTGQDHIYYTEDADGAKTYYKVVPVAISDFATGWTSTSKSYDEIRALATDPVSGYKYEIGADGQKIYYKVDVTEITDFDNAGFVDDENVSVETAKTYTQVTGQDHIYYTEDADGAKTYYKVVPVAISDFATGWTSTSKSYDEIRALATDPVSGYKYEIGADGQKIYYKVDVTEITDFDNAGFVDDENVSVETAKTYTQVTGQDHIYYTEDADGAKTYYKVVPVAISDFTTGWTSTSKSYDEIRALATDPVSGYKYEIGADGQKIYYKIEVQHVNKNTANYVLDRSLTASDLKDASKYTSEGNYIYSTTDADGAKTYYKIVPTSINLKTGKWDATSKSFDDIRKLDTETISGVKYYFEVGVDGAKTYYKIDVAQIKNPKHAQYTEDNSISLDTVIKYTYEKKYSDKENKVYSITDADGAKTYYKIRIEKADLNKGAWASSDLSVDDVKKLKQEGAYYISEKDGIKTYYRISQVVYNTGVDATINVGNKSLNLGNFGIVTTYLGLSGHADSNFLVIGDVANLNHQIGQSTYDAAGVLNHNYYTGSLTGSGDHKTQEQGSKSTLEKINVANATETWNSIVSTVKEYIKDITTIGTFSGSTTTRSGENFENGSSLVQNVKNSFILNNDSTEINTNGQTVRIKVNPTANSFTLGKISKVDGVETNSGAAAVDPGKIIWEFDENYNGNIYITDHFIGVIIAPNATVKSWGNQIGQMIAKVVDVSDSYQGEWHAFSKRGCKSSVEEIKDTVKISKATESKSKAEITQGTEVQKVTEGKSKSEITEGTKVQKVTEGKSKSEITEGTKVQKVTEGKSKSEITEGTKVQKVTEGKSKSEITEGTKVQKVTEGKSKSEITEGTKVQKVTEGKNKSEITEGTKVQKVTEGKSKSEITEGTKVQKVTEGKSKSEITEGTKVQKVTEGKSKSEITEGTKVQKVAEGKSKSEITEGTKVQKVTEGKSKSEITEGTKVQKVAEGKSKSEITEGTKVQKVTEGKSKSEITEGTKVQKVTEGKTKSQISEGTNVQKVSDTKDLNKASDKYKLTGYKTIYAFTANRVVETITTHVFYGERTTPPGPPIDPPTPPVDPPTPPVVPPTPPVVPPTPPVVPPTPPVVPPTPPTITIEEPEVPLAGVLGVRRSRGQVLGAKRVVEAKKRNRGQVLGEKRSRGAEVLGARRTPGTADANSLGMWLSMFGASSGALGAWGLKNKKRKEEEEE